MTAPVVVVGAGLAGAAAAWRLAQAGREVVVLEAVAPAHAGGSSHGSARIFRHAYEDPFWVGLTVRALAGWRELAAASGRAVLTTTGGLDLGTPDGLARTAAALAAHGVAHEVLGAAASRERWPWLAVDGPVLHHPGAGVVDAEVAVAAMLEQARRHGARLVAGDPVAAVTAAGHGADVHLRGGETLAASTVVLAAGAWLPELAPGLPGGIAERLPPLAVTQHQVFHFRFPEPPRRPEDWPVLVQRTDRMRYALPGGRDAGGAGFKLAEHDGGTPTTASSRDGIVDPAARERVVAWVRRWTPTVDPTPYAEATCLYTSTPTEDFVLDRAGPVVVASPCSGHGAKFAPLLGDLIADAVMGGSGVPPRFRLRPPVASAV